ncbi:hypothetical protein OZ675_12865 [Ralstonia pseudosolanacearum]|uniref:hypothetical protein n=1 Tax=Ralstonia pseudosolanacearum TaxID=1310165 RepID=UPI001F1ABE37|nr:hypothetical protein [Ralstonia pseudosolanacearum]
MGLPLRKNSAAPPPACQVTEALGFLRGAWALNVVWQLRDQARRSGELLPAIDILATVGQKLMAARENPPPRPERRPGNKKPAIARRLRGFLLRQARVSRRSSR